MFLQLFISTIMVGVTVVLHAVALELIIRKIPRIESTALRVERDSWKTVTIAVVVLAVFVANVVEIWIWAALYFFVHAVPDFETALYFSTTSFTTVGFGNVMPAPDWQLLGAIEAANGFMLFGWSTAFTFEVLSRLYRKENTAIKGK